MSNLTRKALAIGTPFFALLISIFIVFILTHSYSSPLDEDWTTRQFLIGMFMFAGLTIVPRLLHLQLVFSGMIPFCTMNLSHHPPSLRKTHEVQIGPYSVCVGCFGSFISILIAELIFLWYFLAPNIFQNSLALIYLLIGLILIIVSYSRYLIIFRQRIRLIQHASLFVGVALALIACDLLFTSAFSMMVLLPSWLLFLVGRVKLGKLDHET